MAATTPGYRWKLRQLMAERQLFKTTELGPLLAARGVTLSAVQVYRLVASPPQRLSLPTLCALCDILSCSPNDLIELTDVETDAPKKQTPRINRPRQARVTTP